MKRWETNINIYCNSGGSRSVHRGTSEKQPITVMNSSYEVFVFAIQCAGNFTNDRPRGFLNKDYVKVWLDLENSVDDEIVLTNVLWKNLEVFQNYIFYSLLSVKRINLILFSQISVYFFCCHSLLNWCL